MRKILYAAAGILLSLSICACGVQQASAPVMTEEKGREQGYLSADYKETFNYKPLYAASSPYSAVGENLIKNPGFDGESVQKGGGNAVGVWTAQGAFDSAFSITEDGVDGSACLTFNRAQEGRSASYAGYTVDVKPNTTYVLTAKLRSANMSNPMLRVVGVQEGTFISETAAGQDEGFEETSCSFYTGTNTQINIRFMGNAYEYDFRETLSGKAYLDDLCVYEIGGAAAEVVPAKYRMNDSSYHYTKTSGWSAWKWGVSELLDACRDYYKTTGRRISFEYTLIAGKNDSPDTARKLGAILNEKLRSGRDGMPIHVNLIPVNEVKERDFVRSDKKAVALFAATLEKQGIRATVRRKLGADINASCGQLRRETATNPQ